MSVRSTWCDSVRSTAWVLMVTCLRPGCCFGSGPRLFCLLAAVGMLAVPCCWIGSATGSCSGLDGVGISASCMTLLWGGATVARGGPACCWVGIAGEVGRLGCAGSSWDCGTAGCVDCWLWFHVAHGPGVACCWDCCDGWLLSWAVQTPAAAWAGGQAWLLPSDAAATMLLAP